MTTSQAFACSNCRHSRTFKLLLQAMQGGAVAELATEGGRTAHLEATGFRTFVQGTQYGEPLMVV
jgi:hypothetical protein